MTRARKAPERRGPGRPPLPEDQRLIVVKVRLPPALVSLGQAAAEREGIPWTTWLRQAIVGRVMETVRR